MNKYELVKKIEDFAPIETQEKWDASGWIVDIENQNVEKVMYTLTVTNSVVEEALKQGCDIIISHHPLFFVPLEYSKINIYAAHTNLDKAQGGTTDLILKELGFSGETVNEFVRIVTLENGIAIEELRQKLLKISPKLRYVNNYGVKEVKKIGFCAGSGSEFINTTDCDCFVTGDLKFHTAVDAEKVVFDIGHYESEVFVKDLLEEITGVKGVKANEKSPFI